MVCPVDAGDHDRLVDRHGGTGHRLLTEEGPVDPRLGQRVEGR